MTIAVASMTLIRIVDAVDLGRLEEDVGVDLDRTQTRGGIGREEGIARARAENHDTTLLEMADRAPANVILANLVDAQRRHDPRIGAEALERVLHRERIDHGGEHSHVIRGHPVHTGAREARAAEDVAATDDDGDLDAHVGEFADLRCDALEDTRRDSAPSRSAP